MIKNVITLLTIILSMIAMVTHAQSVLQRESFESTIFPPPGWRQVKLTSNVVASFTRVSAISTLNPNVPAPPSGGSNVMQLNSFIAGSSAFPDTAVLITKPFDFSNNGGINPEFKLSVYRESGFSTQDDHISILINTNPSIVGATLLTNTVGTNKIPRFSGSFPSVVSGTWNQYTYSLPAATYNQKRYYFIILGVAKAGNNTYVDLADAVTYPSPMNASDVSVNLFLQNGASGSLGFTNHMIVGVRCIVGGTSGCGVVNGALSTAIKLDSILFNTNGTTNVNDIQNARVWYTGGSNLFSTGYVSPFPTTAGSDDYPSAQFGQTIVTPATNLDFINGSTSCFYLEYDTTYFWLTYDIKPTATGGNFLDADFRGVAIGGTAGNCPSLPGSSQSILPIDFTLNGNSQIDLPYCLPTYTVGTAFANYTNNDYIQSVSLIGSNGTFINTNIQGGMSYPSNNNTGLPATLGCFGFCDFTSHPPDYELWQTVPARTVTLIQGQQYTISVQAGTWFNDNYITAWIDYNRDGDFIDAGEQLFTPVNLAANVTSNQNFTIPAVGYTGPTRLRVREVYNNSVINPCQQYIYGETEDFNIFISPNCPVGFKLWLGNTDDWFNPSNWCGGVPTINDDVVINKSLVPGLSNRQYFNPTIKNNTIQANCNNITISNTDTLIVNASVPFSPTFKIKGVLTNNGQFKVVNSFNKDITYSNGTIAANVYTPFKSLSSDARTQIIYSQSELLGEGLISGDRITAIKYTIRSKGSFVNYSNFTISYALVPFNQHATSTPYAGPFTTVFGPTSYGTLLGQNILTLSTPIVWDGVSNILIQYCFDNPSNIGSTDDVMFITQTTGRKSTLVLSTSSNVSPGCSLIPGAGVSDNFFSSAGSTRPNFTFVIDRVYGKPIVNVQNNWINNGSFIPGNSLVRFDSTVVQTIGGSSPTPFHELQVDKNVSNQTVSLLNDISVNDTLWLSQGCLVLNGKSLSILNSNPSTGTHTNIGSVSGPITRTNGFIISETPTLLPTVSGVKWTIGTSTGWRSIPFGTNVSTPVVIPFSFDHKLGDLGIFSVSTYGTPIDNTPFPPTVTHLRNYNNSVLPDNSPNVVNRFWMTDKTGLNPITNLVFRWPDTENSIGMSTINQPRAQVWRYVPGPPIYDAWLRISGTAGVGGVPIGSTLGTSIAYTQSTAVVLSALDSCRVSNWDWPIIPGPPTGPIGNYIPWALSNNNQPLPIELADFNAYKVNDKVKITWVTLSETNNSHFVVERYDDNLSNFKEIDVVYSYFGNSTEILNYHTWDYNPLIGLQFYRLRQVDYNGDESYSEYRSVNFGVNPSLNIVNLFGGIDGGLINIEVETNNTSPIKIKIIDVNGKVLYSKENIPTNLGSNKFLIDCKISNGVYFMIVENEFDIKSRRFFK